MVPPGGLMRMRRNWTVIGLSLVAWAVIGGVERDAVKAADPPKTPPTVSYFRDIRPIFQAQCHGCHQPAKASGGYVMTVTDALRKGGESGTPAITPCAASASTTPAAGICNVPTSVRRASPAVSRANPTRIAAPHRIPRGTPS